ncbi:MAG: sigma-54-dependent Fis family transcriptional regulator [Deltaproteobacteria bacterium]|nr:MAG: sigma-54-dependent Fis family transcriptional regulator [Deltaproteobacteria bacterium]
MNEQEVYVLSLGCSAAKNAMAAMGYLVKQTRSWQRLLQSEVLQHSRAVVVHPKSLKHKEIEPLLRSFCRQWPLVDVVVWFPEASASEVRQILRAGAKEVVLEREPEKLAAALGQVIEAQALFSRIVENLDQEEQGRNRFGNMRSRSPKMWDVFTSCERVAPTDATVLILGETGTGKELLARAIHKRSGRKGNFVVLNCGAVAENLVDSELFGHVKGAFTGAIFNKEGLFRHADGGTLFLDEVGNIPLEAQYRLLRVLQEGKVRPVGGNEELPVDVRVIAATNAPLTHLMEQGRFREDLYYRLNVIRLILPPLRERVNDVFFLFAFFCKSLGQQYELQPPAVTEGFLDELSTYPWPGNVRQLENFAERLLLTHTGSSLQSSDFHRMMKRFVGKDEFGHTVVGSGSQTSLPQVEVEDVALPEKKQDASRPARHHHEEVERQDDEEGTTSLEVRLRIDPALSLADNVERGLSEIELRYLDACLQEHRGRVAKTAEHAGITRRTLLRRMNKYELDKHDYRS